MTFTGRSRCAGWPRGWTRQGRLVGLHMRISGQSINAIQQPGGPSRWRGRPADSRPVAKAGDATRLHVPEPADRIRDAPTHVPVGPWRGVNTNQNEACTWSVSSTELARAAGADPLVFRRALMGANPEHLAVPRSGGREGREGPPAAARCAPRHRAVHGCMAATRRRSPEVSINAEGKVKGAPHGAGDQLWSRGQSEPDRGPGRRFGRVQV